MSVGSEGQVTKYIDILLAHSLETNKPTGSIIRGHLELVLYHTRSILESPPLNGIDVFNQLPCYVFSPHRGMWNAEPGAFSSTSTTPRAPLDLQQP